MSSLFLILCEIAVISVALVSGLFLIFSDFLMRSFKLSKDSAGIEVMQVLNREIGKSVTMILLWGNLVLTIGLAGYAYLQGPGPATQLLVLGAALYFVGGLVVSFMANIPMNNRLDRMDYSSAEAATYWNKSYLPRWVFWNWVRALTTGGTAICFLIASVLLAQQAVTI